ncbi:MAG: hypothetical protein ACLP01_07120 [Solirubrobacteraceae bacterium]
MRRSIRTIAATSAVLTSGLLPAQALGGSPSAHWKLPSGVIACRRANVPTTPPQVVTFSLSTQEATVLYVGRECMTLLIAGGPQNPTIGGDLGTYYNVALTPSTAYLVGSRRVSFAHLFTSPQSLTQNAGPIQSITLIGRFDRNYAPLRAAQVVFLPRGQRLPK